MRIYVNYQQNNWIRLLFVIEYVYNNNWHNVIKMSSVAILYRDNDISRWKDQIQKNFEKNVSTTRARVEKVIKLRNQLYKRLKEIKNNQAKYYDEKHISRIFNVEIRFYWISKTFISLNRQRNLIISITNRSKSKNSLKSKLISCDYSIRFEYTMCFMFLCWNRTKNDSTM